MSSAGVRVGVGTRFRYDGETVEVIEMAVTAASNEVVLKDHHGRVMRMAVRELLLSDRARVIPEGPGPSNDDDEDLASVVLAQLSDGQRAALLEKAAHIREVIERTGARVAARFGEGAVTLPSRATAFRVLEDLERRNPQVGEDRSATCSETLHQFNFLLVSLLMPLQKRC